MLGAKSSEGRRRRPPCVRCEVASDVPAFTYYKRNPTAFGSGILGSAPVPSRLLGVGRHDPRNVRRRTELRLGCTRSKEPQ